MNTGGFQSGINLIKCYVLIGESDLAKSIAKFLITI